MKKKLLDICNMNHPGISENTEITCINNRWYTIKNLKKYIKIKNKNDK